jgi:AhpD family alkylhydroperoxidase
MKVFEIENEGRFAMGNENLKDKEILQRIQQEKGWVPNPLKLMENRPGAIEKFMAYNKQIMQEGPLSKREKSLIALAATAAIRSEHCINSKVEDAAIEGINKDEIVQTLLIVGHLVGNAWLHTAYEAINSVK